MTSMEEDDVCDIDTLAELLDDEDDEETPSTEQKVTPSTENESEALKRKLQEMERQMAMLKEQLSSQNNTTKPTSTLKDIGLNFQSQSSTSKPVSKKEEPSTIQKDDAESSDEDEEGNRVVNKYSEFGSFVKQRLAHQPTGDGVKGANSPQGWKAKQGALASLSNTSKQQKQSESPNDNGFTDPFFGIKIINPVVGSTSLSAKMEGRKQIRASQIRMHMRGGEIKDDWVTMAVVVSKGEPRTSQNGKKYSIWKLSDLKDCTKVVSFFLFGEVFNTHWKMAIGSVIGILNPNFMKDEKKSDEVSFTVDNHQKILLVGGSKDLGWCRANRKDGSRCPTFVNKSECEFCIYHVQNEFKKSSAKRADIQSSFSGTGLSTKDRLKQKVLGKDEVFYGGQLFNGRVVAPPATKVKDVKTLNALSLSEHAQRIKAEEEFAKKNVKVEFTERLKNPTAGARNLLRCMDGGNGGTSPISSPSTPKMKSITARDLLEQHKQQLQSMKSAQLEKTQPQTPLLGRGLLSNDREIDLSDEVRFAKPSHPKMDVAKLKALRLIQQKGPLKACDPNNPTLKPSTPELQAKVRKRAIGTSNDDTSDVPHVDTPRPTKRSKAEIDDLLQAKSSHADLINEFEEQQSEQYFSKLERKEQMENKMLETFEIKTTAVTCPKCKYTALSASELCRKEGHPLRTIKTVKRFFQCKDCSKRTMCLDRLPKRPCTNCKGSNWERVAMGKERKGPTLPHEQLLVRGEEVQYLNR